MLISEWSSDVCSSDLISRRSAISSCSNAALLAVALMLSLAAFTPREGAAIVNCTKSAQLTLNPWRQCALRVDTFRGRAGGTFRSESPRYYLYFEAEAAFSVERGRVRVKVSGSGEPVVFTVEPGRHWQGHIEIGRAHV